MEGKFNWKYFFTGAGLTDWYKAWGGGVRLLATLIIITLLGMGVIGVYNTLFPKPASNTVIAKKGSTVTVNQIIQQPTRRWWMPIPYVSVFGEARGSSRTSLDDVQYGYGGQVGLRWDL